ncbi:MAG: phospholipase A [Thermodesulfobacteriota bacterium]
MKFLVTLITLFFWVNAYAEPATQESMAAGDDRDYETLDSLVYLYQPYLTNISSYEPIYFLIGTKPEKSKFQFSFKYRFVDKDGPLVKSHAWVKGFHFGYTQTSYWNLKDDSLPFEDTSYKPELFHISRNIGGRPSWLKGFFMQTGFRHESNGQAEPISRSTNYFYIRPVFIFYREKSRLGLAISPKLWTYIDNSEQNHDLADYRGYAELDVSLGKADSLVLVSKWRWAKEGGSVQVDLSYPASHYLSDNINLYLHFQYVNTLAESLLNYQDRSEAFRLGLSFIR